MTHYVGDRTIDGIAVSADGKPLPPYYDQYALTDRGFEWSYEGPEPAQLAFALLYDHLRDSAKAKALHEQFMKNIVANFDNVWELTSNDIEESIKALNA
ncbi:MAG: hypothetical protein E6Q28_12115 [Afipia sp.]|nr:MAG: hypothetical protein E6Q28_12115 [Afipia sp.]